MKSSGLGDDDDDSDLLSTPPLLTRLSRRAPGDVGDESLIKEQTGGAQHVLHPPVQHRVGDAGETAAAVGHETGLPPPPRWKSAIEARRLQPAAAEVARANEEGTREVDHCASEEEQQRVEMDDPTARDATAVQAEGGEVNSAVVYVEDEPRTSNATTPPYVENPTLLSTERTSSERIQPTAHEQRSHDAIRTPIGVPVALRESRYSQDWDQTLRHAYRVDNYDQGVLRREGSNETRPMPAEGAIPYGFGASSVRVTAKATEEKLVHECEAYQRDNEGDKNKREEPSLQHLAQTQPVGYAAPDNQGDFRTATFTNYTRCTSDDTVEPEGNSNVEGTLPGGRGVTGGGEEATWPPSPPPFPDSSCTESYSPQRQHDDGSQERRDRARSFSLDYRSLTFVERQELEQLAAEHRREELLRAEEEARRELASGGLWMNRTSRAILARSSSLPYDGGAVGRSSSSSPPGTGRHRRHEPSVYERLARPAPDRDGTGDEEWAGEASIGGYGGYGGARERGRQPFTPVINPRSSLLAPRASRRAGRGDCPQQRLYREGEEQLKRRERRAQLADRALRARSVSCHVNPASERVLARRNKARVIRLQSRMMEVLEAVDSEQTGWLCFAGLERVLSECEMLPGQAPPEAYDDVLLAVWTALSRVDPGTGGGGDDRNGDGGADMRDADVETCREGRGEAFGVAVERLSAVLRAVACTSYDYEWTTSSGETSESTRLHASPPKTSRRPSSLNPANPRLWGDEEEEERAMTRFPEPDVFATLPHCDEHLEDLCRYLSDVFKANQRHRQQEEKRVNTSDQHRARAGTETPGLKAMGMAGGCTGAPPTAVATPAQVAATTARFEEQARAKERKIELLRRREEARKSLAHPFEPSMATTSTPQAAAVRRKAAAGGGRRGSGVVGDEGQIPRRTDARTTEERELDENCTFQPRLFQPLPISPPRYPTPKTALGNGWGSEPGQRLTSSADEASPRTSAVDRPTASWMAQVDRLKAGRKDRLRRLELDRVTEHRTQPLPPSVRQLFCDAGMEIAPQLQDIAPAGSSGGAAAQQDNRGRVAKNKGGNAPGAAPAHNFSSSPPRLRLEARLRARDQQKQKRSEKQARKSAEEDAQRQKKKRLLARARKRSAAVVGLEAALAAREAERGRPSWSDPPVVIAEVELVRQEWWVLLPLWADSCPREAAGELAKQQPKAVKGTVAADLEASLRDEIRRACEKTPGAGSEREQDASGNGNGDRGGKNRRAVPTVVLRVDEMNGPLGAVIG
eukprot:g9259.t1